MVRVNRRPFPAAVGILVILTAVLVLAGCTTDKNRNKENVSSESAVLYVGDEPVSEEEYRMLAEEYSNQIYMQYTTDQVNSEDFWETKIDGTAPWERLDELIREELVHNYTVRRLGVELSVTEDYTYEDLLAAGEKENDSRSDTMSEEDGVIYGLTEFDEQTYYKYWYSNLETQVVNALINAGDAVTQDECREYYDANLQEFSYDLGVSVLYAEIPDEAEETALRVRKAMEDADSASEVSEAFEDAAVQELELNSLDTQEGMSGVYGYRWQVASQLQEGEIFGPYEDNGLLCVMKCTERTENGSLEFEAVKSQIQRYLQVSQAQERIAKEQEETETEQGDISPEDIIISLKRGN